MSTIQALNTWIANLCRSRGHVYLDYASAMIDEKGFLKKDLADDGLHPNSAGYRVMAPLAQAVADRLTAPPPPPSKKDKRR